MAKVRRPKMGGLQHLKKLVGATKAQKDKFWSDVSAFGRALDRPLTDNAKCYIAECVKAGQPPVLTRVRELTETPCSP